MKILFLTCWYPTKKNPLHGIFIREHASAIMQSGNEIVVLALTVAKGNKVFVKNETEFTDESGVETHSIQIESRFYKVIYALTPLLYFFMENYFRRKIYQRFKPEIIHANVVSPCGIIAYWIARKYKLPLIISEHWSKVDKFMNRNVFSSVGKRSYDYASVVTVVSGFLKGKISPYVSKKNKIRIIPNIIDTSKFCFKEKFKSEEIVFTAVATWVPPKTPKYFIEALKQIQPVNSKSIVLKLIGEGWLIESYKHDSSIQYKINFLGNLSRENIAALLNETDFFLHSSEIETFSIVVAEALSSGVPVIASNVGALPELVNDKNGILCENTIDSWMEGIIKAMNMKYDRKQISIENATRFSRNQVGQMLTDCYRETLSK